MPKLKKKISKDFTTIHNTMLRDINLGATERGVLLTMLSLPDNWDFSIKGLTSILPDGYTKISTALKNLEKFGYLSRQRIYSNGRICDWEYIFSDEPIVESVESVENNNDSAPQEAETKEVENLKSGNLIQGFQGIENRRSNQIYNNQINNNQVSNNQSIYQSSRDRKATVEKNSDRQIDGYIQERQKYTEIVKANIEFDEFCCWLESKEEAEEIVGMIVRSICSRKKSEIICGQELPREVIRSAMLKVDITCLRNAVEQMQQIDNVRNYEKYFISVLFNEVNGRHFKENAEYRWVEYRSRKDLGMFRSGH